MKRIIFGLAIGALAAFSCGEEETTPKGFFGKSMTQITTSGGQSPQWSPDSNTIVYVYNDDLWSIAPEAGSTPTRLTTMSGFENQPSWHPDANKREIVFLNTPDMSSYTIYTMNVDGGDPVAVHALNSAISYPSFTNDGDRIAYMGRVKGAGINLIPAAGGDEPQKIPKSNSWENLQCAACSPTQPVVVYVEIREGSYNLYTLSLEGGTPNQLTSYINTAGDINQVWFANWSLDGNRIVYTHGSSSYTNVSAIWIIPASGGELQQISEDPPGARSATAESINFFHPSFSPDGLKLVAEHHGQIWILEL